MIESRGGLTTAAGEGERAMGQPRLDGVIFDLDGTLADTLPLCFLAYRRALQPYLGRELSDSDISGHFGPSEEGIFQRLVPHAWAECLELYLDVYAREHAAHGKPFDGLVDVLDRLASGSVRLGIVTGKGRRSAAISLAALGLGPFFSAVETGSPTGGVKPVAIRKILAEWHLDPARVAYVGDQPSDVRDARDAGVVPIGAAWSETADVAALQVEGARAVFTSVRDFADWIST